MISYIYSYDEGIKNKNVGFARIESRNGQCKILVNLKGIDPVNNNEQQVYFFRKEGDKLIGIHIGNLWIKKGEGEFREITNADNIKNSGYALSSLAGIFIRSKEEPKKIFASGWEDGLLKVDNFVLEEDKESTKVDYIEKEQEIHAVTVAEEEEKNYETEVELKKEQEVHTASVAEKAKSHWEQLCSNYTKMQAFEDEPNIISLKINLRDIERLPKKNWPLVNNSFLLHGYYSYRYLILANLDPEQNKDYVIGIPGIFHPNEKFVATMFGFEYFKPAKKSNILAGQFGYWYTRVKEN